MLKNDVEVLVKDINANILCPMYRSILHSQDIVGIIINRESTRMILEVAMNDELIRKLDGLVAKKRNKNISKSDVETYETAWFELAIEEGYSERVENYFFDGMAICGATGLETYIVESKNPQETLNMVVRGARFSSKKDASANFRILVHLMALIIKDDSADNTLLSSLIRWLPTYSKNKEGKLRGDAPKTTQKYFLDEIDGKTKFPDLESLGLKSAFITDFKKLMDDVFGRITGSSLSKTEVQAMAAINNWLHPVVKQAEPAKETAETIEGKIQKEAVEEKVIPHVDNTILSTVAVQKVIVHPAKDEIPAQDSKVEQESKSSPAEALPEKLEQVVSQLQLMSGILKRDIEYSHDSIFQTKKKLDETMRQLSELQKQLDLAEKAKGDIECQNHELKDANVMLTSKQHDMEKQICLLKKELADAKQEITQLIEAKEVLSRDRAKQSEDKIRRLASKLQAEYTDFMDAKGISMSEDLGENMRLQLENVFDILIKAGIPLK